MDRIQQVRLASDNQVFRFGKALSLLADATPDLAHRIGLPSALADNLDEFQSLLSRLRAEQSQGPYANKEAGIVSAEDEWAKSALFQNWSTRRLRRVQRWTWERHGPAVEAQFIAWLERHFLDHDLHVQLMNWRSVFLRLAGRGADQPGGDSSMYPAVSAELQRRMRVYSTPAAALSGLPTRLVLVVAYESTYRVLCSLVREMSNEWLAGLLTMAQREVESMYPPHSPIPNLRYPDCPD